MWWRLNESTWSKAYKTLSIIASVEGEGGLGPRANPMGFAFRARVGGGCALPSPEVASRTHSMLLVRWEPLWRGGGQTTAWNQKGITGSSEHLTPTSKLMEKNWEPRDSCIKQIQFGRGNDVWTQFPDPQIKGEEWNLSQTGEASFDWSSHLGPPLGALHWLCHYLSWYVQKVSFKTFSFKDDLQSSRVSKNRQNKTKNRYIEYVL